jgi:hypothetical protein
MRHEDGKWAENAQYTNQTIWDASEYMGHSKIILKTGFWRCEMDKSGSDATLVMGAVYFTNIFHRTVIQAFVPPLAFKTKMLLLPPVKNLNVQLWNCLQRPEFYYPNGCL